MCFAMGLAVDHQKIRRKNGTLVTHWGSVLAVVNDIYVNHFPDFAKLYPNGLPDANKLRTEFSDRYRQREAKKWRTKRDQCSQDEIVKMEAICDVVFETETRLGRMNTNTVQVPAPDASTWGQYEIRRAGEGTKKAAGVKRKRTQKEESESEEEWKDSDVEAGTPTGSFSISHEVASMEQSSPYEEEFQGGQAFNEEDDDDMIIVAGAPNNSFEHQDPSHANNQAFPAPTTSRHTQVTFPVVARENAIRNLRPQQRVPEPDPQMWHGFDEDANEFPDLFASNMVSHALSGLVDTRPKVAGGRKYGQHFHFEPEDIDLGMDHFPHTRDVNPVAFPMDGSRRKGDRQRGYFHQTGDDDDGIVFPHSGKDWTKDAEDNADDMQDQMDEPMTDHIGMQIGEQIGQQNNDDECVAPLSHGQQLLRRKQDEIVAEAWGKRIQYNRPGDLSPELFPKHLVGPHPFRSYVGDGHTEVEYTWAACKNTLISGVQDQRWNVLWDVLKYVPGIELSKWHHVRDLIDPLVESTGISREFVATAVTQALVGAPKSSLPLQRLLAVPTRRGEGQNDLGTTFQQINSQLGLAMIHTSEVDFSTEQPTYITRKAPSEPAVPINHTRFQPKQFVSQHNALYKQTGEVRRVLLRDEVTGQEQQIDLMLCDDKICGECTPEGKRNYDYAYQRQELPLVHHKDVMMLEDKALFFAPKKQSFITVGAGIVQQDIHEVLFSGGKVSKVIFCDKESCVACFGAICPKSLTEFK